MEDSSTINVTNDFHVQNTTKRPTWHTVQNNCVPLNTEGVDKVIKVETDLRNGFTMFDISKVNDHQNTTEVPLNNQNVPEKNLDLNNDLTNYNKTFSCDICGKKYHLNSQLKRHMDEEHIKQTQVHFKPKKCKYCEKEFKLNFSLNRHIEKCHMNLSECGDHKKVDEQSVCNEHILQTNEKYDHDKKIDLIPNLKLCKLNGVWKSKPNCVYKCKFCLEKFGSQNNLTEHMKIHRGNGNFCQILCKDCNMYVPYDELKEHVLQFHTTNENKCHKCNLRFVNLETLSIHLSHCTKSSRNIWNKFLGYAKANTQTSFSDKGLNNFQQHKNVIETSVSSSKISTNLSSNVSRNQNLIDNNTNRDTNLIVNNGNSICSNTSRRNIPELIDIATDYNNESMVQATSDILMANNCSVNVNHDNSPCTNVTESNYSDLISKRTVCSNEPTVQGVSQNSSTNNFIVNIKKEKDLNPITAVKSSLDKIDAVNSNELDVQSISPHNLIANCNVVNVKKEKNSQSVITTINNSDQLHTASNNESITQIVSHDLTVNNCGINVKKEKISNMENFTSINDLECIDQTDTTYSVESTTVQTTTQHLIMNNCNLNLKKEKVNHNNVNENNDLDQIDVSNRIRESNVQNITCESMINNIRVKKEPESNYDSMRTVRQTEYFTVKKLPINKNVSSVTSYLYHGQASYSDVMYVCNICTTSSVNQHSFALHMISHMECSMHECIVCDQTFLTVRLWTNHMNYHQQQVDVNLMNSQINSTEDEPNNMITTYSENNSPQVLSVTLRNRGHKKNIDHYSTSSSDITTVNYHTDELEKTFSCTLCKKVFSSKVLLMNHQSLHCKSRSFCCKYCDRRFSSRGPCTNHEKSHTSNAKKNLVESIDHQSFEIQNSIQVENLNTDSILITPKKKKKRIFKSQFCYCNICEKRFAKRCYLTNHLKLRHHINPKMPENQVANSSNLNDEVMNINGENSMSEYQKVKLSSESSVSIDRNSNNCVQEISHQQSPLTIHVTAHSNKLYKCRYCGRHFYQRGPFTNHLKSHNNARYKKVKNVGHKNLNTVKLERNDVHQQEENDNSSGLIDNSFIEPSTANLTTTMDSTDQVTTNINRKLYQCQFCCRQFKQRGPFTNHLKSHRNTKYKNIKSKNLNVVKLERNEGHQKSYMSSEIEQSFTKKIRLWFPCDACEKKFSTPFLLVTHRRLHREIAPYLCKICNKSYVVRHRWNRHMKSHYWRNKLKCGKQQTITSKLSSDTSKIEQRHCKTNILELKSNEIRENNTKSTHFECHICKKMYSTSYNRKVHLINVHKLTNLADLDLSASTNVMVQKKGLKMGVIQQSSNQKKSRLMSININNQCHLCGKSYSNKANLYRHQTISHSSDHKVINCSICNRSFKHKFSFREHVRSKHKQLLQSHKRTYNKRNNPSIVCKSNNTQYLCKVCKMEFADKILLETHLKMHDQCLYECNDCGQKFDTNITLGEHIVNSHNNSSTLNDKHSENKASSSRVIDDNVKCNICFKVLKSASYLPFHMRIHSGDRPFKCDKCDMAFRFKPNLRIHKRRH